MNSVTSSSSLSMVFSSLLSPNTITLSSSSSSSLFPFPSFRNHNKNPTTKPFKNSFPLQISATKSPKFSPFDAKTKNPVRYNGQNTLDFSAFAKPVSYLLFFIAIGVCPRIGFFDRPRVANAAVLTEVFRWGRGKEGEVRKRGHLYSGFTDRLLEKVSELIKVIREVREGGKDVGLVEEKLKDVRMRKNELQEEIMEGLYAELRVLRGEMGKLEARSEELEQLAERFTKEEKAYAANAKGEVSEEVKAKFSQLEKSMSEGEMEYNEIWERISEIEDSIARKETLAMSIGVRELSFIERECEQLVKGFVRQMRQQTINRQGFDFFILSIKFSLGFVL